MTDTYESLIAERLTRLQLEIDTNESSLLSTLLSITETAERIARDVTEGRNTSDAAVLARLGADAEGYVAERNAYYREGRALRYIIGRVRVDEQRAASSAPMFETVGALVASDDGTEVTLMTVAEANRAARDAVKATNRARGAKKAAETRARRAAIRKAQAEGTR